MSDARNTSPEPRQSGSPHPEAAAGAPDQSRPRDQRAAEGAEGQDAEDAAEQPRRLAHELNNLLDGSLRNLSLALAELQNPESGAADEETVPEETARKLRTANDSMQQMAELLRRWMEGQGTPDSPGSGGRSAEDRTPASGTEEVALGEAVERTRRQIEPLLLARRIALEVDLSPELEPEPAGALPQVLSNALRNAIEAIDQHGRIELRGERSGDHAALRIRDDGPGPPSTLSRDTNGLPEPGATTKPGGHGMGLTISRRIIEAMGGSLRLDAASEGGAMLILRWPARSADRE